MRAWPVSVTGFLVLQTRLGVLGSPEVFLGGGPVTRRSPLMLVLIAEPGGGGSLVLPGRVRVGFG